MSPSARHDVLLAVFAVLALALHLLLLKWLPADHWLAPRPHKKPVVVEMRPSQARPREVDVPPQVRPSPPRRKPARRLAPVDQVAERETAPRGEAPEDRRPPAQPVPETAGVTSPRPASPAGRLPVPPEAVDLGLPETTQHRLREGWAQKQRQDVEEGDAVWLDTQKDLLASFFQRFRTNIYQVWNYPEAAVERGEAGTCLLRIVINRDGSVDEVKVLETSGHPTLDREAVAAVYRGASYGTLPSSFTDDNLTIMAHFQYRIVSGGGDFGIFGR